MPLSEVPDPVFAGGVMGPGAAIEPTGDTVYSPGPGVVAAAQPTGHAFGLVLDGGVEVLIHVGIDTVNLEGRRVRRQGQERRPGRDSARRS